MQTRTVAPSGRRKITQCMLESQSSLPERVGVTTPGKVLGAFKRAANVLNIPRRVVELIDYLVGCTRALDWNERCVIAWPSNATLSDVLNIGRTQIKTLIRIGQETGLFVMHDSPDGKRYGHRNAEGMVTVAYGFDLSPLAARQHEFERIYYAHTERRREGKILRSKITSERNKILSLCDLGRDICPSDSWASIADQAIEIAAERGEAYDPAFLGPLADRLCLLKQTASDALRPVAGVDNIDIAIPLSVNNDPMGSQNWPLNTSTNHNSISKRNTKTDGPDRPELILEDATNYNKIHQTNDRASVASVKEGNRKRGRSSALRGFIVTPEFIVQIAPIFLQWMTVQRPEWHHLFDASSYVCSELGISQHAWGQACCALGQTEALAVLATIAARNATGVVKSPGGLLRKMVELHETGELRLDRSLFGLADGPVGRPH